jgi:hypothetical protein
MKKTRSKKSRDTVPLRISELVSESKQKLLHFNFHAKKAAKYREGHQRSLQFIIRSFRKISRQMSRDTIPFSIRKRAQIRRVQNFF